MALRYILYPFVFLLVYGNNLYSGSNHSPTLRSFDEHVGEDNSAFVDDTDIIDLIEKVLPYIEEENSTENNEDDSDGGQVFDGDNGLQHGWSSPFADLFRLAHTFIPFLSPAGKATPLYLLNRVFRI